MPGLLTKLLGDRGERAAAKFLKQAGYRIIARQYRNQFGEIDLIASDGDCIVFVEVKTRTSTTSGHPTEAITPSKQEQLTKLALVFLKRHRLLHRRSRFDVIAVIWPTGSKVPEIQHYPNAFEATGRGQLFG